MGKFGQKKWENSESGGIYFEQKLLLFPEFPIAVFPNFPIAFARISHCFCPNFSFSNFFGGTVPPPPPPRLLRLCNLPFTQGSKWQSHDSWRLPVQCSPGSRSAWQDLWRYLSDTPHVAEQALQGDHAVQPAGRYDSSPATFCVSSHSSTCMKSVLKIIGFGPNFHLDFPSWLSTLAFWRLTTLGTCDPGGGGGALTFEKGRGVRPQNLKPYP